MGPQIIQSKIHEIRGQKVMLDFDLAVLYNTETKTLKRTVRRYLERFEGEDFMFELTPEELSRSQFVTLNNGRESNFKHKQFRENFIVLINNRPLQVSVYRSILCVYLSRICLN